MSTSQKEKVLSVMPVYQMVATIETLENQGVNEEGFKLLRSSKQLAKEVADLIIGKAKTEAEIIRLTSDIILLSVDYSRTMEQMIASGNYDWKNDHISAKNFPMPVELIGGVVDVAARLFHFNHEIFPNNNVIKKMDAAGYRPATLAELLALGEKYPEMQRRFPIIALGSVWPDFDGRRRVPGLCGEDGRCGGSSRRGLHPYYLDGIWDVYFRFLGVRK